MMHDKVYIFWDNSNIFVSAQKAAKNKNESDFAQAIRIDLDNLFTLAHAKRPVGGGIVVGSVPPKHAELWNSFQNKLPDSIDLKLLQRITDEQGKTKEQGVDEAIQHSMLKYLSDCNEPQIVVLLTGDGKGYEDGVGFHKELERMYRKGWKIELLAWDLACKKRLKEWAARIGIYIPLESFYPEVTFLKSALSANVSRVAKSVNLKKRKMAHPDRLKVNNEKEDPNVKIIQEKDKEIAQLKIRLKEIQDENAALHAHQEKKRIKRQKRNKGQ